MTIDVALIALVGVLVGLCWRWRLHYGRTAAVLPPELRMARLIYAERLFRSVGTVSITAKVDQVYRNTAGMLVLAELKTRQANRVHCSDVIELSAQRVALMSQTGEVVASHAYVLTDGLDGRRSVCHRVALMAPAEVIALALRRESLFAGDAVARFPRSTGVCRTCVFLQKCDAP